MSTPRAAAALIALVSFAACSSSSSTAPSTGSLLVTVITPAGVIPTVTVSGPSGYKTTVTATTDLKGLASGSYTITASDITTSDSVVASVYHAAITGSPSTLTAGAGATATVTYALRPGTGALWVAGGTVLADSVSVQSMAVAYTSSQLHTSSAGPPAVALNFNVETSGAVDADALAFDSTGNLWVLHAYSQTLVGYHPSQLGTSGSPTSTVTVNLPSATHPLDMAFDAAGDLWIVTEETHTLLEFTPAQLQAGGSPAPIVTINITTNQQEPDQFPISIAFDSQGGLWVVNTSNELDYAYLARYAATQLTVSGAPAPAVLLYAAVSEPQAIAFDKEGNMWLSGAPYIVNNVLYSGRIMELAASSIATSGSPTPVTTLTLPAGNPNGAFPQAIAFDASGDLWYGDFYNSSVNELTPPQMAAGGTPIPLVTITNGTPIYATSLAFNPHSTSLPLH